jgi:hypothetical protein
MFILQTIFINNSRNMKNVQQIQLLLFLWLIDIFPFHSYFSMSVFSRIRQRSHFSFSITFFKDEFFLYADVDMFIRSLFVFFSFSYRESPMVINTTVIVICFFISSNIYVWCIQLSRAFSALSTYFFLSFFLQSLSGMFQILDCLN